MGWFSRKRTAPVEVPGWLIVGDEGVWNCDIVGESHYQAAIARAVRRYADTEEMAAGRLVLDLAQVAVQPEPTNKYDPMALRVTIDDQTVGYIAREDAERFAEVCRFMVGEILNKPMRDAFDWRAIVDARVGWLPGASDLMYGVKLSLPEDFWTRDSWRDPL